MPQVVGPSHPITFVHILSQNGHFLNSEINRNFDLRTELFGEEALGENFAMVQLARELGSCAKQPGSGGAIIGIIPDDDFMERAAPAFAEHGWDLVALEM